MTGILFAANNLVLPFFIGAAFQGAYLAMYYASFRQVDDAMPQHDAAGSLVTVAAAVDSRHPHDTTICSRYGSQAQRPNASVACPSRIRRCRSGTTRSSCNATSD